MSRILIVEDDTLLSSILAEHFRHNGFEIECAYDGEEAVARAIELHFDLILLDIMLPKKDGFEVVTALNSMEATKNIPVVVISNLGDRETIDRMKQYGVKSYIVKAEANPMTILAEVKNVLGS